jgi:hypothetical protein
MPDEHTNHAPEEGQSSEHHEPAVPPELRDHPDLRKPPVRAGRREPDEERD